MATWRTKIPEECEPRRHVQVFTERHGLAEGILLCSGLPRKELFDLIPALTSYFHPGTGVVYLPGPDDGVDEEILETILKSVVEQGKSFFDGSSTFQGFHDTFINVHVVLVLLQFHKLATDVEEGIWHIFLTHKVSLDMLVAIWESFSPALEIDVQSLPPWPQSQYVPPYAVFYLHVLAWHLINLEHIGQLEDHVKDYVFGDSASSEPRLRKFVQARYKEYGLEKGYRPGSPGEGRPSGGNSFSTLKLSQDWKEAVPVQTEYKAKQYLQAGKWTVQDQDEDVDQSISEQMKTHITGAAVSANHNDTKHHQARTWRHHPHDNNLHSSSTWSITNNEDHDAEGQDNPPHIPQEDNKPNPFARLRIPDSSQPSTLNIQLQLSGRNPVATQNFSPVTTMATQEAFWKCDNGDVSDNKHVAGRTNTVGTTHAGAFDPLLAQESSSRWLLGQGFIQGGKAGPSATERSFQSGAQLSPFLQNAQTPSNTALTTNLAQQVPPHIHNSGPQSLTQFPPVINVTSNSPFGFQNSPSQAPGASANLGTRSSQGTEASQNSGRILAPQSSTSQMPGRASAAQLAKRRIAQPKRR